MTQQQNSSDSSSSQLESIPVSSFSFLFSDWFFCLFNFFNPFFLLLLLTFFLFLILSERRRRMKKQKEEAARSIKPDEELLARQSDVHESEESKNGAKSHSITKEPESSQVRKSRLFPTSSDDDCMRFLHSDCRTLAQVLERGARHCLAPNYDCLGHLTPIVAAGKAEESSGGAKAAAATKSKDTHEYTWFSYSAIMARVKHFGAGLVYNLQKSAPKIVTGSKIGIYATNCVDYVVAEFGAYEHSLIVVPLYDTLGPNAVSFVIRESGIQVVAVDTEERFSCLLSQYDQTKGAGACLTTIIIIGAHGHSICESLQSKARGLGLQVYTIGVIEDMGAKHPIEPTKPRGRDLAVICYTSGTTGDPKGAMLTHENVIANLSSVLFQLGKHAPGPGDTYMSFLPLAHMFERCSVAASLMVGARIGFFGGNIKELNTEMTILAPTFLPSVPRLFNRIYDKVHSQVRGSALKRFLLKKGLEAKGAQVRAGIFGSRDTLWDKLIFNKVKDGMGGKVRLIVVGSAPTSPPVLHFMRCALSCIICEGYGQTECVCPCTLTLPGDPETGHVGPPLASAYLKLIDVPEMEYWARENQGEVCVKGPLVFQGYLNDSAKTASAIDNDGWLHTGDIGAWNPNGTLSIIDRKRNMFKLSQGEFVSPERIEAVYARSRFVAQIFVYGESIKNSLVAIVVPDSEVLLGWARETHHPLAEEIRHELDEPATCRKLYADPKVKQVVLEDLYALGRKDGALKGFEQVRDIFLTSESFSIQNGLLTPTLKTKRPECRRFFGEQIELMYRGLD